MKNIVNKMCADQVNLCDVLNKKTCYVGYESDGGIRASLVQVDGDWGFLYHEETSSHGDQPIRLRFKGPGRNDAIRKVVRQGRDVKLFDSQYEMVEWLTKSIPTRYGAAYIAGLILSNNISIYDINQQLAAAYAKNPTAKGTQVHMVLESLFDEIFKSRG